MILLLLLLLLGVRNEIGIEPGIGLETFFGTILVIGEMEMPGGNLGIVVVVVKVFADVFAELAVCLLI